MGHLYAILRSLSAGDAGCPAMWLCLGEAADVQVISACKTGSKEYDNKDKPFAPYS